MKLRLLFLFFILTLVAPAVAAAQSTSTPQAPRPVCFISANPGSVYVGQTVNLSWSSQYATGGTITSLGSVAPSGTQGVIPTAYTTTYVGSFTGPGGVGNCSVSIGILQGSGGDAGGGTTAPPSSVTGTPAPAGTISTGTGLIPCGGTDCQMCHLAGLAQNIINWLVGISIPLAAAMFAYAGIIYFTAGSAGVLGKIDDAHKIFTHVGAGFLIVICAWLGIQTILKTVLSPGFYQSWNTIQCVDNSQRPTNKTVQDLISLLPGLSTQVQATSPTNYGGASVPSCSNGQQLVSGGGSSLCYDPVTEAYTAPTVAAPSNAVYGKAGALCADDNPACSPTILQQVYGYEPQEANAMSCIAVTESAGNPYTPNSSTGACGTFQLTNQTSKSNWQNPKYHAGDCTTATSCNDPACNAQAANLMFNEQGYQPWTGTDPNTGQPWNPNAIACVQKYDPAAYASQVQQ